MPILLLEYNLAFDQNQHFSIMEKKVNIFVQVYGRDIPHLTF